MYLRMSSFVQEFNNNTEYATPCVCIIACEKDDDNPNHIAAVENVRWRKHEKNKLDLHLPEFDHQ